MKFKLIDPEVSGGLGNDTLLDSSTHPPIVSKLHYEFSGWLGDDILESFPCYIVTDRLKIALKKGNLSGVCFDEVKISTSYEFEELQPDIELPKFNWLKINGKPGIDDFGISKDFRLVVSPKVFRVLSAFTIDQADIENY